MRVRDERYRISQLHLEKEIQNDCPFVPIKYSEKKIPTCMLAPRQYDMFVARLRRANEERLNREKLLSPRRPMTPANPERGTPHKRKSPSITVMVTRDGVDKEIEFVGKFTLCRDSDVEKIANTFAIANRLTDTQKIRLKQQLETGMQNAFYRVSN